jgi:multidrug efflux pump subunit AcrB
MNVSTWAIQKPLPSILLFIFLCVAGLVGFNKLAISKFPDVSMPLITISVALPGATPAQLETEVTRKVEDAVASISQIRTLVSTVNEGSSRTMIEFRLEKDVKEALDQCRDAIARIRSDLPADIEEPIVAKADFVGGTRLPLNLAPRVHRN